LIAGAEVTNREAALLGTMLAVLSVLASWIITHMYSESQSQSIIQDVQEQHRTNLRTYALKAAEKVNNLSNELSKLSLYLEEELDYTDYPGAETELSSKEERIESAIHIINTLKSVNDTALSDWEGVIGDELDQQREDREAKEERLQTLIERAESVFEGDFFAPAAPQLRSSESMHEEIEELRRELRKATSQLSGTTLPRRVQKKEPRREVVRPCPICKEQVMYEQRPLSNSVKTLNCLHCGEKLISRFADTEFELTQRIPAQERPQCPACSTTNVVLLDVYPKSAVRTSCVSCGQAFRVIRTASGGIECKIIGTAAVTKTSGLDEQLLKRVKEEMPLQPWPTGTHKAVAERLGITPTLVNRALQELTKAGVFHPQIDGVLYAPISPRAESEAGPDEAHQRHSAVK